MTIQQLSVAARGAPPKPAQRADVADWGATIGSDSLRFVTRSMRRTKAVMVYRRTGEVGAMQLLLDHTKIESSLTRSRSPRKST